MYHGLPVVAVKNRGHETIIKDGKNGFLVPLNNSDKMAEKVLQIANDSELRTKVTNVDIEGFDSERVAEAIVDVIEEIVAG